jgi:competence ComEA-like helix-hairpin-helix protein
MEETTENLEVETDKININKADVKELDALWGIGKSSAKNIIAYREHNGPFQKIEDITNVKYITERKFEHFKDEISVGFEKPTQRTFDVVFDLYMASDGQVPDYDGTLDAKNLTKTYTYTLITDMAGNIMDGTWDDVKSHPDFAWVPYNNIDSSRGSENTFLKWSTLKKLVPEELLRMK